MKDQRTNQWPKVLKILKEREQMGLKIIRRHKSMKDREHNGQKFEDTKGLIRRHKSMKDREHNGQKFEDMKSLNQYQRPKV